MLPLDAMPRTRAQRAHQAYVATWRALPAATHLEVASFLDLRALSRLEVCGRQSLDAVRAWTTRLTPRGSLSADLSTKQVVAATASVRALLPTSVDGLVAAQTGEIWRHDNVSFEDFAFTVVIAWESRARRGRVETAEFPFMELVCDPEDMGAFANISSMQFVPAPTGPGQDAISPWLRALQNCWSHNRQTNRLAAYSVPEMVHEWDPAAYIICTRRSDNASVRVATFSSGSLDADMNELRAHIGNSSTQQGDIGFDRGLMDMEAFTTEGYRMSLNLIFDMATGRIVTFCGGPYDADDDPMPQTVFYACLCAKLDLSQTRA